MLNPELHELLKKLSDFAHSRQSEVWVVGGVVRDSLLQRSSEDLDLVLEGDISTFAPDFAALINCRLTEFNQFLTAKLTEFSEDIGTVSLDLAAMRSEIYHKPGALPTVSAGNFEQDCKRRDFTVNALYLRLSDFLAGNIKPEFIEDKTTGITDLNQRLIRVMHDKSFIDDPTRLFRALRYMVRIGGKFEDSTGVLFDEAIKRRVLDTISCQRKLNELKKACQSEEWKEILSLFIDHHLLADLIDSDNQAELKKMLEAKVTEPFDLLCAALYYLNPDQDKFRKYGFGKKFFKQAEDYRRYFEMI